MAATNEFSDAEKMYQLVIERFEGVSASQEMAPAAFPQTIDMNPELIELILDLYANAEGFPFEKMQQFSIEEILRYLQATHRYYLSKKLPEIEQSMLHIFSKYSESHQLLAGLAYFFNDYKAKLIEHIRFEEKELFPYIQALIKMSKEPPTLQKTVHLASNPDFSIHNFIEAHSCIEDELEEVSALIRRYSGNQALPLPYRIFLNQVEIFELELRKHAIIEDHVLVPMALELEKKMN
jgi:regulator of cell morphogenesis and NO signaling